MSNSWTTLALSAGLGMVSGIRSMSGLALVSHHLSRHGRVGSARSALVSALSSKTVSNTISALAVGEIAADKTSAIPDRTETAPMLGRAALGAVAAMAAAEYRGSRKSAAAAVGAASAVASTFLFFHLRKTAKEKLHIPDWAAAFAEDSLVLSAGSMIAAAIINRA